MILIRSTIQVIPKVSSILFIILFVYASVSKILDHSTFQVQLGQSPILTSYAEWISWFVPLIELVIASLFLFASTKIWAFYLSYSLMVMFTVYIILVLNFSDYIPCSCGGVLEKLSWTEHIFFNLFFILLSLFSILLIENQNSLNLDVI